MAYQGGSMQQRYNKQNALLAKQVESGDGLYHMMASATLTRGRDLFLCVAVRVYFCPCVSVRVFFYTNVCVFIFVCIFIYFTEGS